MGKLSWDALEALCEVHAVSGREDRMIRYLKDTLASYGEEIHIDRLGNVTCVVPGSDVSAPTVLLQAHIDEIGLIVRGITDKGFLLFQRVGGVPEKSLLGQAVDILTEEEEILSGYVATKSHHITTAEEKYRVPTPLEMCIDVGARSAEEVASWGIRVGDPVTYRPNFHRVGPSRIVSKALDNRVSVFILLEVLKRLRHRRARSRVVFLFSVLEELSIRGSLPAVRRIDPDVIFSLDITPAVDSPVDDADLQPVRLGGGPAIKMMDFHGRGTLAGAISSPALRRLVVKTAQISSIPLQREVIIGVVTDPAFQMYEGEEGMRVCGISIPQRYTHAPISMVDEVDVVHAVELVYTLASQFHSDVDLSRG